MILIQCIFPSSDSPKRLVCLQGHCLKLVSSSISFSSRSSLFNGLAKSAHLISEFAYKWTRIFELPYLRVGIQMYKTMWAFSQALRIFYNSISHSWGLECWEEPNFLMENNPIIRFLELGKQGNSFSGGAIGARGPGNSLIHPSLIEERKFLGWVRINRPLSQVCYPGFSWFFPAQVNHVQRSK